MPWGVIVEHTLPVDSGLPAFFDAIPSILFLTDGNVRILEANRSAREWLHLDYWQPLSHSSGETLHCIFPREARGHCGTTEFCPRCVIRQSVEAVVAGRPAPRRVAHMILERDGRSQDRWFLVGASLLPLDGRELVLLALEDITQLVELRELLPLCPGCGGKRDLADPVAQAQVFLRKHPDFLLAHELCVDCQQKAPAGPGPLDGTEDTT
jgi:PAS domain-containing protein